MSVFQASLRNIAKTIENFNELTGKLVSWLTLFMVITVFTVVIMRYLFNIGSIPLQESVTYLHGMVFLLGAAYTLKHNEHVRVDVFYSTMTKKNKAWVDLIGTVVFLFPVCLFIFLMSFDYVVLSWQINESSGESGGLPALYLLKSLILIMPVLMMMQGVAIIINSYLSLFAGSMAND